MTNPLVTADWLHEHRNDAKLLIFDVRNPNSKITAKIPNSIYFDLEHTFSDENSDLPHTMTSSEKFQVEVRKLGVNQDSKIVVYDDIGLYWSPRVWWMFKSVGLDVLLLDGGLKSWKDSGFEIVGHYSNRLKSGILQHIIGQHSFCDSGFVLNSISDKTVTIIDARNSDRYNGLFDEPRKGLRRGHIPSAINIPFEDCLEGNFLKSKSELEQLFKDIDRNFKLIFSCGSGVTACIVALAACVVGFEKLSVYDGSWSEWGRSDFPVA